MKNKGLAKEAARASDRHNINRKFVSIYISYVTLKVQIYLMNNKGLDKEEACSKVAQWDLNRYKSNINSALSKYQLRNFSLPLRPPSRPHV